MTDQIDTNTWQDAGRNLKFIVIDDVLFIAVSIDDAAIKASPLSSSGKSKSIGSTEGNVSIPETTVKMGVNVYAPVKRA